MTSSSNLILQHYIKLTEFLGKALGPDYEVALHDLTRKDRSIIAIANNYISGREVGAPLTNMALSSLRDKSYERMDYHLHYYSINVNGKDLRSSTFFIKDNGKLIGLLCINFDDSRYRAISDHILKLCHPDLFVTDVLAQPLPESEDDISARSSRKNSATPQMRWLWTPSIGSWNGWGSRPATSPTASGFRSSLLWNPPAFFLLKGAIKSAAAALGCSTASIYRYLSQITPLTKPESTEKAEVYPFNL